MTEPFYDEYDGPILDKVDFVPSYAPQNECPFVCDGLCQPAAWQCDGVLDCIDGADERDCAALAAVDLPERVECGDFIEMHRHRGPQLLRTLFVPLNVTRVHCVWFIEAPRDYTLRMNVSAKKPIQLWIHDSPVERQERLIFSLDDDTVNMANVASTQR